MTKSMRFNPIWKPNSGNQIKGLINLMCDAYSGSSSQIWVEIGTYTGESALIISSFNFVKKLHCVDINIEKYKKILNTRLEHGISTNQICLHNKTSKEYSDQVEDFSIDGIYIDGCHKKESVELDLSVWHRKVKKNGFICGHDYNKKEYTGVVDAVDSFCNKNKYSLRKYIDSSWMILR